MEGRGMESAVWDGNERGGGAPFTAWKGMFVGLGGLRMKER